MVLKYKNNLINKISSCKFSSPGEHYLAKSTFRKIMPNTRRHSYDLIFKLKIVAEAEVGQQSMAGDSRRACYKIIQVMRYL